MSAEAATDTAIIEQAEAAPLDDGYETRPAPERKPEPPAAAEPAPGEESLPSAAALSEARRRRRLRFPPRG